jgi:hypothetical protein
MIIENISPGIEEKILKMSMVTTNIELCVKVLERMIR